MKESNENRAENWGPPLHDVYCRGCHTRPSYKFNSTYYCPECWDRFKKLRYQKGSQVLEDSDVDAYVEGLISFIRGRNRYVWEAELFLYYRPLKRGELKKRKIDVATICRELGFFAPEDDRIIKQNREKIVNFVDQFMKEHGRTPNVREALKGSGLDHMTFWTCIDYFSYVAKFDDRVDTYVRYRYRDSSEFLQAAADAVRKAGCPLQMVEILDMLNISYPSYLAHFHTVKSEQIHEAAGVGLSRQGLASLLEVAAKKAITDLGYDVETQVSFPDLRSKRGRVLKYDFRLTGTNTLIEIDGDQHFTPGTMFYKETIIEHDKLKNAYAKRKGYRLIRVDVRKRKSPKSIMEYLRPRIGFGPLNPSNALNTEGPARRGIKRKDTRDRPGPR